MHAEHLFCYEAKLANLKCKTQPKQPSGSEQLHIALPTVARQEAAATALHASVQCTGMHMPTYFAAWVTYDLKMFTTLTHGGISVKT
jgi:hypothetical protein